MKNHALCKNNVVLAVRDEGEGPPILFVHGFPFDHSMWNRAFEAFAHCTAGNPAGQSSEAFRLIAPDLRGLGESELPPGTRMITMEEYADDLRDLISVMDVREKITICGLSMGGYIVMQYARKYAETLSGIVLCSTKTIADPVPVVENRKILATNLFNRSAKLDSVADTMLPRLFAESTYQDHPELVREMRNRIESNNPFGAAAASLGMAERPDTTELLAELDVPILVLCGSEDKFSPPSEMKPIAEKAKRGTYVEISGTGHLPPLESPQRFVEEIKNFVQKQNVSR